MTVTEPSSPTPQGTPERRTELPDGAQQVRLRRAPRYRAFVVSGVVAGILLGVVLAFVVEPPTGPEEFSRGTIVRYFAVILGLLGGVVGAGLAVLVERRR